LLVSSAPRATAIDRQTLHAEISWYPHDTATSHIAEMKSKIVVEEHQRETMATMKPRSHSMERIPDAIGNGSQRFELPILILGATQWSEEGCYINSAVIEPAPYSYCNEAAPSMDPELCISICKKNNNWLYAMPFGDGTCYCAGELPAGGLSGDDRQCNKPCLGCPNELCGGYGDDQVARIRYWKNPLESARTELPPVSPPFSFV
jgi:hypothetical protein